MRTVRQGGKQKSKMKEKKTNKFTKLWLILLAIVGLFFVCAFTGQPMITYAAAATTPRYTVHFSYNAWYKSNTSTSSTGNATDTTSARIRIGQSTYSTYSIELWGSGASGTGDLPIGGYINSSTVNVKLNSTSGSPKMIIKNSSGTEVGSGTGTVSMSGLSDGTYTGTFSASGGWLVNNRQYDQAGFDASFSFRIDTSKPTGTLYGGTSTVANGGTTKASYIKFIPSDTSSGVKTSYIKTPSSSSYSVYTSGSQYSELGTYQFYCVDNAGNQSVTYTITLQASHIHSYSAKVIAPTCTSNGYTEHICSCGDRYTDSITASLGHNFSDWRVTTSATCTSNGQRTATCTRCSQSKTETITALGHDYSVLVSSSGDSCTSAGTSVYKCSRCTMTKSITGSALGHNYKATITEATCTQKGFTTHTCTRCQNSYTDKETAALGHEYVRTVTEANCVDGGGTKQSCTRCGDTYMTDQTLPLGHSYQVTTIEATCTRNGYTLHSCVRCSDEYRSDEVLATGHLYSSEVVRYSTCVSDGERYHSCDRCGDEYRTIIPATGHFYQITDEQKSGGTIRRTYTCNVCGDRYVEDLGDQYEKVTTYVEYLFNQYSPYMIWVFLATAGLWSIAIGVALIIAHKNEDKEKAKKMIVNYLVGLVVIFCILVACPYLVRGIAILVS